MLLGASSCLGHPAPLSLLSHNQQKSIKDCQMKLRQFSTMLNPVETLVLFYSTSFKKTYLIIFRATPKLHERTMRRDPMRRVRKGDFAGDGRWNKLNNTTTSRKRSGNLEL